MITSIVRWWKSVVRQNYIYVVSYFENDDHICVCFYDAKDAVEYASAIERIHRVDTHISESELL